MTYGPCYRKITIDLVRMGPSYPLPKYVEVLVLQQDAYIDRLDNGLKDRPPWTEIHSSQHLA
jgi:hypothetical protein